MNKLFDYTYYRIYDFYENKFKDDIPWLYSICLLSVIQLINILSILLIYLAKYMPSYHRSPWLGALIAAIFLLFNAIRYLVYKKITLLKAKWKNESVQKRKQHGIWVVVYIIVSVVSIVLVLAMFNRKVYGG